MLRPAKPRKPVKPRRAIRHTITRHKAAPRYPRKTRRL